MFDYLEKVRKIALGGCWGSGWVKLHSDTGH